jgi:hypothetical protein
MTETQRVPPGVDPATPSPARLYDYCLGGTDNFPVDRDAAEKIRARMPELADAAWANRGFHQRADPVGLFGSGGDSEIEPLEVGGPGSVEGSAGPPGIQPGEVDRCRGGGVF